MIIDHGCASFDNHIPRDYIFDYHSPRECNIYIICLPRVILPNALILQDECVGKNYSSFLDFTRNYERTSGIFAPGNVLTNLFTCFSLGTF